MPVRVLVVDDQEMVRKSLSLLFDSEDEIELVGLADTGEEAIHQTQKLHPDVILMDLRMPGMDGMEAARQIHAKYPRTKIILLTGYRNNDYLLDSLDPSAIGFFRKDTSAHSLVSVIKEMAENHSP
jgi:DNA-binding NarL/FixJ family response regulator